MVLLVAAACGGPDDGGGAGTPPPDTGTDRRPTTLPRFAEVGLWSPGSVWNTPVGPGAAVDPRSEAYVARLVAEAGDGAVLAYGQYTATVFFADADTTPTDVHLTCGEPWELGVDTLRGVRVPPWAVPSRDVDGADNPVPPGGCGEDADQDNHMVIVDRASGCVTDLWQARREDGRWVASWGNGLPIDSDGVFERGLSTRGSGFGFLGGVIWPDELASGTIGHALAVAIGGVSDVGPVPPATESDGTSPDPDALPEGARLRLDPGVDLDTLGLTPVERTVAEALQRYGAVIADDASEGVQLYAVNADSTSVFPYRGVLDPDEDYAVLGGLPLDRLEVLRLGEVDPRWADRIAPVPGPCARFG